MKKMLTPILMTVLAVYLILMFINMSANYDKVAENVSFTTVENTSTSDVFYVHQLIFEITDIHIDGIHYNIDETIQSINLIEDGSITLVANATGTGELVEIIYLYQEPSSEFTSVFISIMPLILIIVVLGGIAFTMYKKH